MFLLQITVVLLIAVGASAVLVLTVRREADREAANRSLAVAESFAHAPGIEAALKSADPASVLQERTLEAAKRADVDFIVIVDREGIRLTSSTPSLIGKRTTQDMAPLLAGRTARDKTTGTLGPQIRAFVPVKDAHGGVIGAVGAGITIGSVSGTVDRQLPVLLGGAAGAVALTTGGAALVSRRLSRQTHGLGPAEITRMFEHHDAVLHAVREGILIIDGGGRILLANDEARRLLGLPPDAEGRHVRELGLAPQTAELLASNREATDEMHLSGGRVLAVNQRHIDKHGGPPGNVVTFRDSTELQALSGRAEEAGRRLKLLYDATVGIGTTLDVTRTAEELAEVAVPQFADHVTVDLAEPVLRGEEAVGTQKVLRRTATAGIRLGHPLLPTGTPIKFSATGPRLRGVGTGRAVIEPDLHQAVEWQTQDVRRAEQVLAYGIHSLISAPLSARGSFLGVANFWRSGNSETFRDDDLALAEELCARAAVSIDNARRYTREHDMAVTLQRSLLPSSLPAQNALDVAYRYLPAQKNVGGDWFDVIPLPGTRVALVVGDVVGHGMHAAITMGRLRAAVHTFSALDLQPGEVLAHLDELVDVLDRSEETAESAGAIAGATCLYAIYDPVDRRCTMARAGHPPPAIVYPDGTVEFLELPAGPPLGVGGLPFETAEVVVPEGSRLVLYTDGLIENRGRDIDEGLDKLARTLGLAGEDPERMCEAVLDAMPPAHATDDIALLVARTRSLPSDRVSRWDVPSDPSAVGPLRTAVANKLAEWDLEETSFVTELILSELITNAIRYASGPIRVRLLLDRQLTCEVSDGSSTSPHLSYATATDEGGRGLFLVAQMADRWGTRYTPEGKVIWSEQPLPEGYAAGAG
ncbi:SpoIIE family protein phosphatase [Streptomyces sp. 150FB]|uniref:SpoIIE family protein phosphatase n=1 Tax=Streptomyces sp. 150FB TaxID=1576605 RepID=UPI000698506E|nr:SpoIIE family protein phosphatase [Streptomyces sp. 150FB]